MRVYQPFAGPLVRTWLASRLRRPSARPSAVDDTPPVPIYSDHERALLAEIRKNEERVARLAMTNKMLRDAVEDLKDLLRSYGHTI